MRKIFLILILLITIIILVINFKLISGRQSIEDIEDDILMQLNFLETELKENDLDIRMQSLFPEGLVFINALYGLTWCELALSDRSDIKLKNKAVNEALYAFKKIDSKNAKKSFPDYISPEYGIFYNGWKNYLLSKIFLVDMDFDDSGSYSMKFAIQSEKINKAIFSSETPYLESYDSQSWPADTFVAIASLANYDNAFGSRYEVTLKHWLDKVRNRLDKTSGMIPHRVNPNTGVSFDEARGCSMSLMLRFLDEIDPQFMNEHYRLFKDQFVSEIFGLPIVREYPKGVKGSGDIDSGPVVFDIGSVATIVALGTFNINGDFDLARRQYQTINAFGLGFRTQNKKTYIFGLMPMADAFIAWGRASGLNIIEDFEYQDKFIWFPQFHLLSVILLFSLWSIYFRKTIFTKLIIKRRSNKL